MDDIVVDSRNSVRRVSEQIHYDKLKHEIEHLENKFLKLRERERSHALHKIQELCDEFGFKLDKLKKHIHCL
ncbi:MAG: hypothetical protein P8L77_04960 [Gammaproteobacteria bacterium]|nr:hypothetical protein [Gammaproteobacteria bacterium]